MSIKVLVADDEPLVRKGLRLMLRQVGEDVGEVLEAANGREALAVAAAEAPDVVFLDIRMPGAGGLEVMRELRSRCPRTRVVILTAYDRFDYAQEALRQGAVDYLVKPLEEEQLVQALARCRAALSDEAKRQAREAFTRAVRRSLEEALVLELVGRVQGGSRTEAELHGLLEQLLGKGAGLPQVCLVMEPRGGQPSDWEDMRQICASALEPWSVLCAVIEHRLVLLARPPVGHASVSKEQVEALGRRLIEVLRDKMGLETNVGIGRTCSQSSELGVSYGEALLTLEALASEGEKCACRHIADLEGDRKSAWSYPWQEEQELLKAVRLGMWAQARERAQTLIGEVLRYSPYVGERRARAAEILALVSRAALQAGAEPRAVLHFSCRQLRRLPAADAATALREWMDTVMAGVTSLVKATGRSRTEQTVLQAEAYMRENLSRNLTLEEVARKVYLSPAYFSTLFHKHKGCSFSNYLERLRVEAAADLLAATDEPVYSVARSVGYRDPNYFARVFRKVTGEPPSAFRRRHRGQGKPNCL
ncbi:MAG: response regulator [Moorellales bacterium]